MPGEASELFICNCMRNLVLQLGEILEAQRAFRYCYVPEISSRVSRKYNKKFELQQGVARTLSI